MNVLNCKRGHFPNPDTSIVTIILTDWVNKRIAELSTGPQTPANQLSLQRFRGADIKKMLMEPPVIMDDGTMKVCVLSRKVGIMWIDQIIKKLDWPRFIKWIDPTDQFSTLPTTTPGIATKADLLRIADASTHTNDHAKIYLTALEGTTEKGLVFEAKDQTITPEIFTQDFLKSYGFDDLTVTIKSKGDPDYPVITGSLLDMSIGTLTVTEDLLHEETVTYRIFALPTIKGLIHANDQTIYDGSYTHNGFIKY